MSQSLLSIAIFVIDFPSWITYLLQRQSKYRTYIHLFATCFTPDGGICSLEAQNKVLFESFWIHSREVAKNFTRPPWWTSNDGQAFRVPLVEG